VSAYAGKHVVVLGGAGFIGARLVERLKREGVAGITVVDNGCTSNLMRLKGQVRIVYADITENSFERQIGSAHFVFNLASPASPVHYHRLWRETLRVGSLGTENALALAESRGATFLQASTSEVYGDPLVHPQVEDYFGNVNPVGPRAVYDEAKRYAEALVAAFNRHRGVQTRIARIFNTYGPGMQANDGRVVPNLIKQALRREPLTVYGTGAQTRSFCYVDDLVDGLLRLAASDVTAPVNLGNPHEVSILEFAELIRELVGVAPLECPVVFKPKPQGDPERRRPDITRAKQLLGWEPTTPLREGLRKTIDYFRTVV